MTNKQRQRKELIQANFNRFFNKIIDDWYNANPPVRPDDAPAVTDKDKKDAFEEHFKIINILSGDVDGELDPDVKKTHLKDFCKYLLSRPNDAIQHLIDLVAKFEWNEHEINFEGFSTRKEPYLRKKSSNNEDTFNSDEFFTDIQEIIIEAINEELVGDNEEIVQRREQTIDFTTGFRKELFFHRTLTLFNSNVKNPAIDGSESFTSHFGYLLDPYNDFFGKRAISSLDSETFDRFSLLVAYQMQYFIKQSSEVFNQKVVSILAEFKKPEGFFPDILDVSDRQKIIMHFRELASGEDNPYRGNINSFIRIFEEATQEDFSKTDLQRVLLDLQERKIFEINCEKDAKIEFKELISDEYDSNTELPNESFISFIQEFIIAVPGDINDLSIDILEEKMNEILRLPRTLQNRFRVSILQEVIKETRDLQEQMGTENEKIQESFKRKMDTLARIKKDFFPTPTNLEPIKGSVVKIIQSSSEKNSHETQKSLLRRQITCIETYKSTVGKYENTKKTFIFDAKRRIEEIESWYKEGIISENRRDSLIALKREEIVTLESSTNTHSRFGIFFRPSRQKYTKDVILEEEGDFPQKVLHRTNDVIVHYLYTKDVIDDNGEIIHHKGERIVYDSDVINPNAFDENHQRVPRQNLFLHRKGEFASEKDVVRYCERNQNDLGLSFIQPGETKPYFVTTKIPFEESGTVKKSLLDVRKKTQEVVQLTFMDKLTRFFYGEKNFTTWKTCELIEKDRKLMQASRLPPTEGEENQGVTTLKHFTAQMTIQR